MPTTAVGGKRKRAATDDHARMVAIPNLGSIAMPPYLRMVQRNGRGVADRPKFLADDGAKSLVEMVRIRESDEPADLRHRQGAGGPKHLRLCTSVTAFARNGFFITRVFFADRIVAANDDGDLTKLQ